MGHLLAYNIIRTIMAEAVHKVGVRPDELSFIGAWQTVNAFLPNMRIATDEEQCPRLWATLVDAVGQHRVGDRPDRIEPRALKRRPKHYPYLQGTRTGARARLRKRAKRSGKKR